MPIYILRVGETGPVKIGRASNIVARIRELQGCHFETLNLIRVIEGGHTNERWMHRHYVAQKIRGEWFTFSDDMMTVVPGEARWRPGGTVMIDPPSDGAERAL